MAPDPACRIDCPPPITDVLTDLVETFEALGDWEERYRHIIEMGRSLAPLADDERSDANRVRGCASRVWLVVTAGREGRFHFRGDSDAHLVRGLIALLLGLYAGRTAEEILAFDATNAIARLGLRGALSAQRANGLAAMVARIRALAVPQAALSPEAPASPKTAS